MTRSELTVEKMKDMGWETRYMNYEDNRYYPIEDVVENIKNGAFRHLRCVTNGKTYSYRRYDMCATYDVYYHNEVLEYSWDGERWFPAAERKIIDYAKCIWAD